MFNSAEGFLVPVVFDQCQTNQQNRNAKKDAETSQYSSRRAFPIILYSDGSGKDPWQGFTLWEGIGELGTGKGEHIPLGKAGSFNRCFLFDDRLRGPWDRRAVLGTGQVFNRPSNPFDPQTLR